MKFKLQNTIRSFRKKRRQIAFVGLLGIIIFTPMAVFLARNPGFIQAGWFDDSFAFRQTFSFTHNAALTDRAVTVTLDTAELIAAGAMQADCDDTRFTDINGLELLYDLTGTCDNASTTYEVIFPTIISGDHLAYVYYGSPTALNKEIDSTGYTALTPSGGDPAAITDRTGEEKGPSPVAYWKFDEGYGTTTVSSVTQISISSSSEGPNSTTSITSEVIGSFPWSNPTNAQSSNNDDADSTKAPGGGGFVSDYLQAVNFGFSIPTNATITGIELDVEKACSDSVMCTDYRVRIVKGGSVGTTDKSEVGYWGTTDATSTYGSSSDLWGETWTASDINASNFGVAFAGSADDSGTSLYVDHMQVTVYYTESNTNAGTISGATWQPDDLCFSDKCLWFDGSDDVVTVTNDDSIDFDTGLSDALTFSAWVRVNSDGENSTGEIFDKGSATFLRVDSEGTDGLVDLQASLDLATTDATLNVSDAIKLGQWHHVAMTYADDGDDEITLYVDGLAVGTSSDGSGAPAGTDTNNLLIGGDTSNNFHGFIDEVKVYPYERSAAEIKTDANHYAGSTGAAASFGPSKIFLSEGLVGYWKMDEITLTNDCATDTVFDYSGNSNNATSCPNTTGPTATSDGKYGNAIDLDGAADYLEVADSASLEIPAGTGITLSAWIKTNDTANDITILGKNADALNDTYYLKVAFGCLRFGAKDTNYFGPSDVTGTTCSLRDDVWHHLAATYDPSSNQAVLYIDGQIEATSTPPNASTGAIGTADTLLIGAENGGADYFEDLIDEVRIYTTAKTAQQIADLYRSSSKSIAYYPMNEGAGTSTVYDRSVNGNHGTMNGSMTENDWVSGKYGHGLNFDGSDDDISVSYNTDTDFGTGSFSISTWAKMLSTSGSSLDYQVSSGAGDAGEAETGYAFSSTSTNLSVVGAVNDYDRFQSGFLFPSVAIPQGTTITSAYFEGYNDSSGQVTLVSNIRGEDVDDAADFSTSADVNGRTRTTASVTWDTTLTYQAFNQSPDISSIIEEIVGRGGWSSGNDMVIFVDGDSNGSTVTGSIRAYDGTAANAAKLHVEFGSPEQFIATRYSGAGWKLYYSSDNICFGIDDDSTWSPDDTVCTTSGGYDDATWHHIEAVKDGTSTIRLYVDGVLAATDGSLAATGSLSGTTPTMYLGVDSDGSTGPLNGSLDEFQIYDYARTDSQIIEDMNGGHPIPGSPVGSVYGHWKFDNGYGDTAIDSGTGGNDGDLGGSGQTCPGDANTSCPAWTTSGKYNNALDFDLGGTSDDYVSMGDPAGLELEMPFTLSAWVNLDQLPTTAGTDFTIMSKYNLGSSNNFTWDISSSADDLYMFKHDGTSGNYSDTSANPVFDSNDVGNWVHVAISVDASGNHTGYKNGIPVGTATFASSNMNTTTGAHFVVGARYLSGSPSNYFDGQIDDVRVYKSSLDADQLKVLYNQGFQTSFGVLGTDSSGNPSDAADRAYCPPGDTTSSCGPVAHWKLDENTGTSTARDISGNGYELVITDGSSSIWQPGKVGTGLLLNGSTQYATAGSENGSFSVNNHTVSAWIYRRTDSGGGEVIVDNRNDATNGWIMYIGSSDLLTCTRNSTASESTSTIATNTWYFATCAIEGTTQKLYLNGALEDSDEVTGSVTETTDVRIGARSFTSPSGYFPGIIDDVRVYDYGRSNAQVAWDYNRGAPVAWYKFDECSGSSTYDSSGNELHGTITEGGSGTNTSIGTCAGSAGSMWADGATGKLNSSLEFDGTDEYVSVPYQASLGITADITLTAWIKRNSLTQKGDFFVKTNVSNWDYEFGIDQPGYNDQLFFYADVPGWFFQASDRTIADTNWHHVAFTRSGSSTTMYIDGETSGTSTATGSFNNGSYPTRLGGDSDTVYFSGNLDDLRIYTYALTSKQIKLVMNEGAVRFGPETGSP